MTETRVPPSGSFARQGTELATVHVTPAGPGGETRKVLARGYRGDAQVVVGVERFTLPASGTSRVAVVLRASLPDWDGDGIPDAIDDRCLGASDGGGCVAPARDAGVSPDRPAQAPDAPSAPDGAIADAADDRPSAPPVDAPPPPDAPPGADRPADSPPRIPDAGPPPADASRPIELGRGLVGYWKFDEGSGMTAVDSSGNGLVGMTRNVAAGDWVPGYRGGAIAFTERGWIKTSATSVLDSIRTQTTIAAWIFRTANQTSSRVILQRQSSTDRIAEHFGLFVIDNRLWMIGIGINSLASPAALPLSRWTHVAGVYDGANIRLYVDGAEVIRASRPGAFAADTTPLTMGAGLNTADPEFAEQHLHARLDEVVLYNRTLAPDEIAALAAGQPPR